MLAMTEDVWNALAKTTASVARLIDAVDGPLYTRIDGSTGRDHSAGLLGQQETTNRILGEQNRQITELRERLEVIAVTPTKISMPRWWTPIAVALIGGLATVLVAVLQTLRAVS